MTENLTGKEWDNAEADLFRVFSDNYRDEARYHDFNSDPVKVSFALRTVIETTVIGTQNQNLWRRSFNQAVCEVLVGFREERPLLKSDSISMKQWMRLRVVTISGKYAFFMYKVSNLIPRFLVRPFLLLGRADMGLPATTSKFGNPLDPTYPVLVATGAGKNLTSIRKIECLLQIILGLQNDILGKTPPQVSLYTANITSLAGWEKDSTTNNPLSAVQVLISQGTHPAVALNNVITIHNNLVKECVGLAEAVMRRPLDPRHVEGVSGLGRYLRTTAAQKGEYEIRKYVEIIVGFANGMAQWMAVSKRYIV